MKRLLLALALFSSNAFAESYTYFREVTLSSNTEKLTIQQPNSPTRVVSFVGGSLYCSVACTVTMERGSNQATSTLAVPTRINDVGAASTVNVYTASNASTGTTITKFVIAAGQTLPIDLSEASLNSANANVSFKTDSITGDVKMSIIWREQ